VKPGEDSTGGVWEVETATPDATLTILTVRVIPKDAQYGTILTCHFRHSKERSAAAHDVDSSSLVSSAPALSQSRDRQCVIMSQIILLCTIFL